MAIVSISEAARLVRKGRQTLYNHNEKGTLSFAKDDDGNVGVDTSELIRRYGKLHLTIEQAQEYGQDSETVNRDSSRQFETGGKDRARQSDTDVDNGLDSALQAEIDRISELLDIEKTERERERVQSADQIDDLRNQRDKWEKQASTAMLRLEYQETKEKESIDLGKPEPVPTPEPKRGLWDKLFS